jgi:tRNA threonylcarbamoyladenosine biosynthesis protein TsaE
LYRLADSEELEWIGIDDYLNENALCFVEWADKGAGVLPAANVNISLTIQRDGRLLQINGLNTIKTS